MSRPRLIGLSPITAVAVIDGSTGRRQTEEVCPEEGEDEVGYAEAVALEQRVEGEGGDGIGPADPGAGFDRQAVAGGE